MKISKLKHELEILDLQYKHTMDLLKLEQELRRKALTNKCRHMYDDGTSAKIMKGDKCDWWNVCEICAKTL